MLTCPELKKFNSDGRHRSAGVAHPVERHLAKVEVASSSLVTRSRKRRTSKWMSFFFQRNKSLRICEMPFGREIWLRHVKCLRA